MSSKRSMQTRAHISPNRVLEFAHQLFDPVLHAKRIASIADATVGVLRGTSLAIHAIGGDPEAKTMPADVDPRLARFLRFLTVESQGGRAQDAWELYKQVNKVREQLWGPHEFVPLEL